MKIYVASHDLASARDIAEALIMEGHFITSRWLGTPGGELPPTKSYTETDRRRIAVEDVEDVLAADALVLQAGPDKYAGGKFVEAGVALASGKQVYMLGRRENMLLWHPTVVQVDTLPELLNKLLDRR
jgi:nucleoside 2-deoxyribosyltransferase